MTKGNTEELDEELVEQLMKAGKELEVAEDLLYEKGVMGEFRESLSQARMDIFTLLLEYNYEKQVVENERSG